jgi:Tfp pilus assembly protein PilZ
MVMPLHIEKVASAVFIIIMIAMLMWSYRYYMSMGFIFLGIANMFAIAGFVLILLQNLFDRFKRLKAFAYILYVIFGLWIIFFSLGLIRFIKP